MVARVGKAVVHVAEQRGLAGAGRGDQRRGHAGLDGGQQAGEHLVEERQAEVVVGGDLAVTGASSPSWKSLAGIC